MPFNWAKRTKQAKRRRAFFGSAEFCQAWNRNAVAALICIKPETAGPSYKTTMPINKEVAMKRLLLAGAAALVLASFMPDDASAQRGRYGGGMGIGGGGGGFRAAAISGGYRGVGIGRGGYAIRSAGIARGVGIGGGGYAIRSAGIVPGGVWRGRRGWGWGFPVAAGLAAAGAWGYYNYPSYGYSSYDRCVAWDGYQWINVCYGDVGYSYNNGP